MQMIFFLVFFIFTSFVYAQPTNESIKEPIVVNGDRVEYSADQRQVSAEGNVSVIYKDTKLTCKKIKVNLQNQEAEAETDVRIEDKKGILYAEGAKYNFSLKTGGIINASLIAPPYYAEGKTVQKVSEDKYEIKNGYFTTCDFDHPHYLVSSNNIQIYPQDKVIIKKAKVQVGKLPLFYLPSYTHSLKDPFMHVRLIPGKSGDWGPYLLSAWRVSLTDSQMARVYLDYREKLGTAEGFGLNYATHNLGKGDYKFYYTQEHPKKLPQESPAEFERYLVRWRHQWEIQPQTNAVLEFYKIQDTKRIILGDNYNFLKDYFYREYEKDSQPKTYLSLNHALPNSYLNLLIQKRINSWYTHQYLVPDEKLPQVSYSLPSFSLGVGNLYLKNHMEFANLLNNDISAQDDDVVRFDIYNELFYPSKFFIFNIRPFVASRQTYYSKDKDGNSLDPRTVFYTGIDVSTKFYRFFNFYNGIFDINGIKHIITPNIKYLYNHKPTVPKSKLQVFDDLDTIERNHRMDFELINKFQTKRNDESVDFAVLKLNTSYNLERNSAVSKGFSDFLIDLELVPFSWLRVESDANFDIPQKKFKIVNFDIVNNLGKGRSFGLGHRYERKGGKELTSEFNWCFNPKWSMRIYERYQFAKIKGEGLKEQEYGFSRDLHCWIMNFTYNISKEHGHTFWVIFRLKAFPKMEMEFEQSYHGPKQSE